MSDYRISKNRTEIIKCLSSKLSTESKITVWQKNDDGSRSFLEQIPFFALYPDEGVFTLNVPNKKVHIDPVKEIYFLLEGNDFIFKTKIAIDQKEQLTFQIPREIRLKELRRQERTYFSLDERKFVDVVFSLKKNENENQMSLTCPLVNISEGGACIVVSKEAISNIDFNCDILLKCTNEFQKAVIRNARLFIKKNLNNDELYAIGVQFQ